MISVFQNLSGKKWAIHTDQLYVAFYTPLGGLAINPLKYYAVWWISVKVGYVDGWLWTPDKGIHYPVKPWR